MEDLQHILPDQMRKLAGRKVYVVLIALVAIFGFLCITLALILSVHAIKYSNGKGNDEASIGGMSAAIKAGNKFLPLPPGVCGSSECLRTAAWMTDNMDRTIQPCDDFYQYACGGWVKKKSIPYGSSYYSVNSQLYNENEDKIHALIQSEHKNASKTERKVKDFYKSCLHDYGRMEDGGKTVIDIVKNKFGGWYALDPNNWQGSQWDATAALTSAISEYLVDTLIEINVYGDRRNRSRNIIAIKSAHLGMYSNYYTDDSKVHIQSIYKKYMRDMGSLLLRDANVTMNDSQREETLTTFVEDAYYHEYQIAKGIRYRRTMPRFWYSPIVTIEEFSRNFTQINWLEVLRGYFGPDINAQTSIYVRNLPYFEMIEEIMRNETENKNRILNNFLVWSFVDTYAHQLSWEYRMTASSLNEAFRGPSDMIPTWDQCIRAVMSRMSSALAAEFILQHVGEDSRQQVSTMFTQLKSQFTDAIDEIHWMDNTTKLRAKEKVSKLESMVGFPESYFSLTFIENLHSDLVINTSLSYFANLMNTNLFVRKLKRMQLDAGRQYSQWRYVMDRSSFSSTLRYFWNSHKVLIPAGAMQFPLMNKQHPGVFTAAALGNKMAQGIYLSISQMGRYRWHNGSYYNWWSARTYAGYLLAQECFRDILKATEVGPYVINGQNVTLMLRKYTSSTVIMDTVGVKLAYQLFKKYYEEADASYKLPLGIGLSEEQTFFLSYAQSNCDKRSDRSAYNRVRAGYIPARERVNTVLGNMKEFSTAFKCSAGDNMTINNSCDFF